jgi:hypothetical protein
MLWAFRRYKEETGGVGAGVTVCNCADCVWMDEREFGMQFNLIIQRLNKLDPLLKKASVLWIKKWFNASLSNDESCSNAAVCQLIPAVALPNEEMKFPTLNLSPSLTHSLSFNCTC